MLNNLLLNNVLEVGTFDIQGTSNSWSWYHINYSKEYKRIPMVLLTEAKNQSVPIAPTVINRTVNGCDVGIWNNTSKHTYQYVIIG